jgi:hypothetical protein
VRVRAVIVGLIAFATFVAIVLVVRPIVSPRIICRATAPDGTEMSLVQKFNWSGEPFTTSFVYRKPGDAWRWFYYDHQDDYWGSSRVVLNTNANTAVFYRRSLPAVTFNWNTASYTLHRRNTTNSPGSPMPGGWSPEASVKTGR